MAASVRIEDDAFSDLRFDRLAVAAGLADADHARGKMARIWRQCTIECRENLEVSDVVAILGQNAVSALTSARLGMLDDTVIGSDGEPTVRICGAHGRIEWLQKLRNNGRKGGRPRKNQKVLSAKTRCKPTGSENRNPPAPAPAPAPAPEREYVCGTQEGADHASPAAPDKPSANANAKLNAKARALAIAAAEAFAGAGRRTDAEGRNLRRLCLALAKSGHTPDEVRAVVRAKAAEWARDPKMAGYVKPSVILARTKFEKYLEEDLPLPHGDPVKRPICANTVIVEPDGEVRGGWRV